MHRPLRPLLPAAAIAAASVLFQLPFFDRWWSLMDEGHMLQFADVVANGGELYRDATVYPLPGAFYLLAAAFRAFEPSILLSRWIVVIEFGLFAALAWLLLRRLVSVPFALLGVACLWLYRVWAFPHWQIYSYSTTALLVFLASLLVLLAALERDDRRLLGLSGLLYGLGVFCKQDYGAAALLATLAVLGVHARAWEPARRGGFWARLAVFLLPAALVGGLTGLHFLRQGLLPDLLQFTVLNHFVGMTSYEYATFPDLFPLLGQDPALRGPVAVYLYWPALVVTADLASIRQSWWYANTGLGELVLRVFYYGPYLLLLLGGVRLWRRRDLLRKPERRGAQLRELALYALAASLVLLVTLNRPQDYVHLAVLYWPLVLLAVVYLHDASRGRVRALPALLALAAISAAGAYTARMVAALRAQYDTPIPLERAGVRARPVQARFLADLIREVREASSPAQSVAALPYAPLLNFLAERRGPHRAGYIVWPFPEIPDRDAAVVEGMERDQTPVVVYTYSGHFPTFPPFDVYADGIHDYLVERYEIAQILSYDVWDAIYAILRRSEPAEGGGRPLPAADATVRWTDRAGATAEVSAERAADRFRSGDWAFEPVWTLHAEGGTSIELRVDVEVEPGERLRTAVGLHPKDWSMIFPTPSHFAIDVEADGVRETLYERALEPTYQPGDRGWFPVEVELERFAGRRVRLAFRNRLGSEKTDSPGRFSWAAPRLVREGAS